MKQQLGAWYAPVIDTLQGTIAVGFIMWLASAPSKALMPYVHGRTKSFYECGPIHLLGTISYSLYLVHYPVVEFLNHIFVRAGLTGLTRVAIVGVFGTSVSVLIAYLFYLPFERPFCRAGKNSRGVVVAA
jgi:peptidoglycan/LPS O-acetylase OafA/YrhL